MGILKDGFPSIEELKATPGYPHDERLRKGACAVIECVQEIPCNPCETICPKNAINVGDPITKLPVLTENDCIGCALCVAVCPGQAIFIVDKSFAPGKALVGFPFEYLPLPVRGEKVQAVDRAGEYVCDGTVVRIMDTKNNDRTPVVFIEIDVDKADQVRSMKRRSR